MPRCSIRRCTPTSSYSRIASIGMPGDGVMMIWNSDGRFLPSLSKAALYQVPLIRSKRELPPTFRRGAGLSTVRALLGGAARDECERVLL